MHHILALIQFNSMKICVHINPEKAQQPRRRLSQYLFWWRVGGVAKHLARHINYALCLCKYLGKFIEYIDNIDIDDITYLNCHPSQEIQDIFSLFQLSLVPRDRIQFPTVLYMYGRL